jgi:nucleosome binding factor SPN SPT16 subunit
VNGFRYQSTGGEHLNVMYQNIRLAIMQSSANELNTCILFVLKRPINIAKKPSRISALTDQAEMAEEGRKRRFRKKINHELQKTNMISLLLQAVTEEQVKNQIMDAVERARVRWQ